jgi:hypothetical protein
LFISRRPGSGGLRPVIGAVAAVFALLVVLALPASAHEKSARLYGASVTPRMGTPATPIAFTVTYRSRDGREPAFVRVRIDGAGHDMGASHTGWDRGVVYHYTTKLEIGVHSIVFEADDGHGDTYLQRAGKVRIESRATPDPTPEPTHRPGPTPDPTREPKPDPTPERTPNPTPTPDDAQMPAPTATPRRGGDATGGGIARGSDSGKGGGTAPVGTTPGGSTPGGPAAGGGIPANDPAGAPGGHGGSAAGGAVRGGTGDGGGDGWGALASALESVGLGPDAPFLSLTPTLVGTTGAVAMALSFAIFGKKRRDEEQPAPDEVLRAQAARGTDVASSGELVRSAFGTSATLVPAVVRNAAFPAPTDVEATMPRWRRPSLIEARKADPRRGLSVSQRMSFDDSRVEPAEGYERRTIRYRVVRLLDAPDELRSADIGQLDQGDEVQLIERWGAYWLVLCPDGRQGWLHKMTLGDVVDATPSPTAFEAMGGDEIDADVLAAFMAARARA